MKVLLTLGSLVLVAGSSTSAGAAPLGNSDLMAAVAAQAGKHHGDVFSSPTPNTQIAGHLFKVSLPLFQAFTGVGLRGDGMAGSWSYDRIHHALVLDVRQQIWPYVSMMMNDVAPHGIDGFYLSYGLRSGKNYAGQNAFGARATIYAYRATGVGLAYPRRDSDDDSGLPPPKDALGFAYKAEIPMVGETARKVTKTIRFVAEGHITQFADGNNIVCGSVAGNPTMASRIDLSTQFCLIAAQIDRVSFQDSAGRIYAHWERTREN